VIPFEFAADSSKIGGAGVRLIVAKADRRFSFRQMILESRLIKPVWAYVIGDAIARGFLPPIEGQPPFPFPRPAPQCILRPR
jgi:hypothetical protein